MVHLETTVKEWLILKAFGGSNVTLFSYHLVIQDVKILFAFSGALNRV